MTDQHEAFARLELATAELSSAMVGGEPAVIESLARAGESELSRMRSILLKITSALTDFAEMRASQTEKLPLDPNIRNDFERSAKQLLEAGYQFQRLCRRASSLAVGGSSYATACIQMCGVPPTTYRAPVLRYADGGMSR